MSKKDCVKNSQFYPIPFLTTYPFLYLFPFLHPFPPFWAQIFFSYFIAVFFLLLPFSVSTFFKDLFSFAYASPFVHLCPLFEPLSSFLQALSLFVPLAPVLHSFPPYCNHFPLIASLSRFCVDTRFTYHFLVFSSFPVILHPFPVFCTLPFFCTPTLFFIQAFLHINEIP